MNLIEKNNENENKGEIKNDRDDKNNNVLSNSEIENNIWVQVTKETFDDLLLGNEIKDNSDDIFSNQKNNISDNNGNNNSNNDDLEKYFINSGFFLKIEESKGKEKENSRLSVMPKVSLRTTFTFSEGSRQQRKNSKISKLKTVEEMEPIPEEIKFPDDNEKKEDYILESIEEKEKNIISDDINDLYSKELDKETLLDLLDKQKSQDMEEYILNQLKLLEKEGMSFSNEALINEIMKSSKTAKNQQKISLAFKYNFECIKEFLDEIFFSFAVFSIDSINC